MDTPNTPHELSTTLCDELMAMLPAYSMGTVTPEEHRLVEALLPFCPEAQAVLDDYRQISDTFLTIVPLEETPPPVDALLQRVQRYEQTQAAPRRNGEARRARQRPASAAPRATEVPKTAPPVRPVQRSSRAGVWLGLVAACLLFVLVGTNLFWASQLDVLRREQQAFLAALNATPEINLVSTGANHHRALLPAEPVAEDSEAAFVWNSGDQVGALVISGLPTLQPGETYQLWLVREGHSLSLGTFGVDTDGVGFLVFHSPEPIEQFSHIGVSVEPAGGTEEPTSPHVVIGNI
jgi:hypothetical protein